METEATMPRTTSSRGRLMATLFAAQVCGSTGHSIGMAIGGIMAAGITGTNTWSGMPVAVGALGTALASWPLSRLMERAGRRPGLALGYGLAVLGALVGMVGVTVGSFVLLLGGMALFGVSQTSNLLSRYAAADVSPSAQRGRAMGLIVWGSSAGSMVGPNLMEPAPRLGAWLGVALALHLGGMYVASPLSGWLCDRLGRLPMIGVGALVLTGAVLLAGLAPGSDRTLVILGLFLNGVGWNFAFVAGSALLTDALSPAERASTQGLADLFMGLVGAFGSAAGGMILGVWGLTVLNTLGARPRTARRDVTAPPRPLPHLAGWQAAEKGASACSENAALPDRALRPRIRG